MSLHDDLVGVTRGLAGAIARESSLNAEDLDTALCARHHLLGLLREIHGFASRDVGEAAQSGLAAVAIDPVRQFGTLLDRFPDPHPEVSTSHALARPATTDVGRCWQATLRHVTAAGYDWHGAVRPLSDDQAWTAIADVAALSLAVDVCDSRLIRAAGHYGRTDVAAALSAGQRTGLRLVAREVAALAGGGPLPDWARTWTPYRAGVRVVAGAEDLSPAQTNMASLLRRSRSLSPNAAHHVAMAQARCAGIVAERLRGDSRFTPAADRATVAATALTDAVRRPHQLAALHPSLDDRLVLQQAGEILRFVRTQGPSLALPAARAFADRVPALVAALREVGARELRTGRWLVPNDSRHRGTAGLAWVPLRRAQVARDPALEPDLLRSLTLLAEAAQPGRRPVRASTLDNTNPHAGLAGIADSGRPRPTHPSRRAVPSRAKERGPMSPH